jgi:hypothetical protein
MHISIKYENFGHKYIIFHFQLTGSIKEDTVYACTIAHLKKQITSL